METIGERLKRLRETKGISQGELAKRAGLKSQGAIGNIERGTRGYGASIIAIARVLGTTPEYLSLQGSAPDAKTPGPTPPGQRFDAVTEDEHNMLMLFRGMSDDDRAELTEEMRTRAAKWAALVQKVLAQTRAVKNGND